MRFTLASLSLLGALAIPAAAHADSFSFNLNGGANGFSGSGILTTTPNGAGVYTITGVTGTGSGSGVKGLISFNGNDNLLFPSAPSVLDGKGFSFVDVLNGDTFA